MRAWHHQLIANTWLEPLTYQIVHIYYQIRFRAERFIRKGEPILIYQMGKVGSSTLYHTLKHTVTERPIYHIHNLTDVGIEQIALQSALNQRAFPGPEYWQSQYLIAKLRREVNKEWHLITLTRDPVARNLSGFFQSLPLWSKDANSRFQQNERETLFQELANVFLHSYPHSKPHIWFDEELKKVFEIDVYETPFNTEDGFSIYTNSQAKILLIRLEDLSYCYQDALAYFFDLTTYEHELIRINEAGQKDYKQLYQAFLDWLVLPEDFLDQQYNTRYAKHFYTELERGKFRQHWLKSPK